MFVVLSLCLSTGCKKPGESPGSAPAAEKAPPASPAPATEAPAAPPKASAVVAVPTAASAGTDQPAPVASPPGTDGSDAKAATPTTESTPVPKPSAPARNLSDKPIPRQEPAASTLCKRACNKAARCGTARGNVTNCVGGCLAALSAKEGDLARHAVGFRAQEKCADVLCAEFETCVGKALVGQKALAAAPAISPKEAAARCARMCDKERTCAPERHKERPGGHRSCLVSCEQRWISPTDQMALERVFMMRTLPCLEKPCGAFEECVRKGIMQHKKAP